MESKELLLNTEIDINNEQVEIVGLSTICRFCAGQNERLVGIFSEEGACHDLANKINLYMPVKVAISDQLPLHCCWNCAGTILAWHELVVSCVETDKRLRRAEFLVAKEVEPVGENSISDGENDGIEPETIISSLNDFGGEPLLKPKKQNQQEQSQPCFPNPIDSYMTDLIDPELVDNPEYKIDIDTDPIMTEEDKVKPEDQRLFGCPYCQAIFIEQHQMLSHMQTDHEKEYEVFSKKGSTEALMKKQKRKVNKIDPEVINAAKVVVDGRVYFNCKECGKSLHSPYTYVWHMRIHTGERPYVCDLCGKQFRVSQGLVRHLRETHEGIKKFPCDLCGRMFATRRNVEEHRRIHTNERPYVCDLCGKSFKQKASLFVHKRSHKNYFPFKCSYCNQGFRTKPPLMVHITRHTGVKPYKCDICGRGFRIKYELKRHRLIHSDEKPWVCNICGFSFRQKRYLRNHTKSNHTPIGS